MNHIEKKQLSLVTFPLLSQNFVCQQSTGYIRSFVVYDTTDEKSVSHRDRFTIKIITNGKRGDSKRFIGDS